MKKETRKKSSAHVKSGGVERSYTAWIADLKRRYRVTQIKAAVAVNSALIEFYWNLGKDISEKYPGKKRNIAFFANLSRDLCLGMSDISGLSERNIRYSLAFYELYSYLQQVVADNELIGPQSVEQSDRRKRVTSKVPQVVANSYRQQVFDVADVFRPLGAPLSGSSNGPVVAQSDLCQSEQTERVVLTSTMGGVVDGVGNTAGGGNDTRTEDSDRKPGQKVRTENLR